MSADWPKVALEDLLKPVSRPEDVEPDETYHILGAHWYAEGLYTKEIKEGSQIRAKKIYRVEEGDFVYNRLFAWKGSFAIATERNDGCYVSNEFPCFSLKRDRIDGRYLWRYFSCVSAWSEALGLSTGGTPTSRNRLKVEKFLAMKIPLPLLDEQRRIVARIEELAAKIDEAQKHRRQAAEEAEALIGSMTKHFFELDGTKHLSTTLDNVTTRITKGESPSWQGFSYQDYGPLFIRSENVLWGELDLLKQVRIPEAFHQKLLRSQLQKGDVLINLVGASIGRACVVPDNIGEANINQAVAVISPNLNKLDYDYLMQFLISVPAQEIIHSSKVETARPNISLGDLRKLIIPLPPLAEQRRIVAHLDELQAKVDALKKYQAQSGQELDALLPSVLDKAFKGEL